MLIKHFTSIGAAAALLALPMALTAQEPEDFMEDLDDASMASKVDVEARAGVGMGAADLAEFTAPGVAVGAGAGFWLTDHFALRVDGDFNKLAGDDSGAGVATAPDMSIFHYGAGVEFDVLGREVADSPWKLRVNAGAGGSTLDTDDFIDDVDEGGDLTENVGNVNAGAEIGRQLSENVMLSVAGRAFYMFLDEDNFNNLAELRPTAGPIQEGVNVPVTLTLRWDIPNPGAVGN